MASNWKPQNLYTEHSTKISTSTYFIIGTKESAIYKDHILYKGAVEDIQMSDEI